MPRHFEFEYKTTNTDFDVDGAKRIAFSLSSNLGKRMSESYANNLKIVLLRVKAFATRETFNSIEAKQVLSSPSRFLVQNSVFASRNIVNIQFGRQAGLRPPPVASLFAWADALGVPRRALNAIARSIGRKGIRPREVQKRALNASKPAFQSAITVYLRKLVEAIFKPTS